MHACWCLRFSPFALFLTGCTIRFAQWNKYLTYLDIHTQLTYLKPVVNIHSHLWGAVLFIYLLAKFNSQHRAGTTWVDSAVFSVFLSSAVICLSASSFYHTVTCHSEKVRLAHVFFRFALSELTSLSEWISSSCHALDYSGIVILTVGSFYPCLYYGFYCQAHLQIFYILSITLVGLGKWLWSWSSYNGPRSWSCLSPWIVWWTGAAYIVLNPEYAKPTHRGARTAVFISLGLCALVPVSHLLGTYGSRHLFSEMGFGWLLASGGLYIIGALL